MVLSSSHCGSKYDVFVSFRGYDIRDSFFSHLDAALEKQGIKVFKDSELEAGEDISLGMSKAIEDSRIALIIFSENYAASQWCLDELVKIMEYRVNYKRKVIPVFYRVNPKDVRKLAGSYGKALIKHEKYEDWTKINAWRNALRNASCISGWDSRNIRPDTVLIEEIVKDIANKLKQETPELRWSQTQASSCRSSVGNNASTELLQATEEPSGCFARERLSGPEYSPRYARSMKKRRRITSNRESSGRRSKMRKQMVLEGLVKEVRRLQHETNQLKQCIDITSRRYNEIESTNRFLRAQAVEPTEIGVFMGWVGSGRVGLSRFWRKIGSGQISQRGTGVSKLNRTEPTCGWVGSVGQR